MTSHRSETVALLRLSLPIILAQIAHVLLGIIDTIMVSPLGPAAIAGVGVGNSVFFAVLVVGLGILLSMDSFVSAAFGAKDHQQAHQYLIQGLWLAIIASVPLTLGLWILAEVFPMFGSTPDVIAVAQPFLRMTSVSIPFFLISVALQRYWQARQRALIVTITGFSACLINIITIYAFVYGNWGFQPHGAAGIAVATLCCRVFIAGTLWIYTEIHEGIFRSQYSNRLDWKSLKQLLLLGLPSGGQCLLEVGMFCMAGVFCTRFGAPSSAAHHIVLSIASFTFMLPLGIGSATAVRVGFHRGEGKIREALQTGWLGICLSALVMSICAVLLLVMPMPFLRLFTQDSEVLQIAIRVMIWVAAFQIFDGIQVAATGALRGMQNTTSAMWMNLLGHYVFSLSIGLTASQYFGMQVRGIWLGLTAGLMVVALGLLAAWSRLSYRALR